MAFTAVLITAGTAGMFAVFIVALSTGAVPVVAVASAGAVLFGGAVALYVRERPAAVPPVSPRVDVDWAVSDVCLTVSCPCTPHITRTVDGYTFGRFRCPVCGDRYVLPTKFGAYRLAE